MEWSLKTTKRLVFVLGTFLAIGLCVFTAIPANAQVTGATLSGTVTDASGAVISGAQISIKDSATGITHDVTSDTAGLYTAPNLIPGSYEVKVSASGFSTAVQSNLTLGVGAQQQLNFSLKVGQASTTVEVTEAAPQVDLTSSALSGQVESETVRELPLNGRDWTSLAQLQPGVKPIDTQMSYATSARGNRGFGGEMTISGQRSTFNNYRIDGISVNDYAMAAPGNVIGVVLGVDAIQEFQVLTGGFPAEYGRATGGVINAISRSGTNQFHGTAYEFLRNNALDANDYFTKTSTNPLTGQAYSTPPFIRNQYGASAGAPIIKDRLFVFADYEGLRQIKGIPTSYTVWSDNARQGIMAGQTVPVGPGGNTGAGTSCTTNGNPGTWISNQSTTCVSNYSQALLALWPHANAAVNGDKGNFVYDGIQRVPEDFGTSRIDYKIGNNDMLFGTFLKDQADYTQPDAYGDVITHSNTSRTTISIEESHTFGSSFVNAARIGFNRDNVLNQFTPTVTNSVGGQAAGDLALGAVAGQYAPRLTVKGGIKDFIGGINAGSHYKHAWNSYQAYDDAFWTLGSHTIKFGGGVENMRYNEHTYQEPGGRYQFNNPTAFLQGNPKSWEASLVNAVDEPREFRQTAFSLYLQDDWKLKQNLTVNLGVRYEPTTVLSDAQGRITNLANIGDTSPVCGAQFSAPIPVQPGSSCGSVGPYYKNPTLRNFEPRMGFAWDPFKDGKSSVRGSFGIYDVDPFAGYFLLQQNQAAPFLIFKSVSTGNGGNFAGQFQPGDGGTQLSNSTLSQLAMSTIEGTPKRTYVMQYNMSLQRQLTSDMSLTVGYVGSHGVHLLTRGDDGNMAGAPGTSAPAVQTPYGWLFPCGPSSAPIGACTPGVTPTGANAQVNPALGTIRYIYWNTDSHYNGLNVNLDKKFAHGYQFQVSYTWSKSLDDNSQTIAGDTFANGINSPVWWLPKAYYGPSDFNVAHTLTINALYSIPTPKSWNGAMKEALADWELGGIFTFHTGSPTTAINNGDPLGLGNVGADQSGPLVHLPGCNQYANYVGSLPGSPQWINQNCFTEPYLPTSALAGLQYGCAFSAVQNAPTGNTNCLNLMPFSWGRNTINGPNIASMDFSVHKIFPIHRISETFNVQFRWEVFNIFNRDNFVPPQPCSGDCNSGLINSDGTYAGVGNISLLAGLPREMQFALKVNW
jgi:Carboxypeptidase regulatory-like domain/TonB-dependent Receptor Plug Domain